MISFQFTLSVCLLLTSACVQGFVGTTTTGRSIGKRTHVARLSETASSDTETETESESAPVTYAQCGKCQSAFTLSKDDIKGRGRRLECGVCGHSWFQSKDRLMTLNDSFEMVDLPQTDLDRIAENIKEGKSPKYVGDMKLYVGNIAFGSTEGDLMELFSEVGTVGEISLVRDDQGRNRGFGFITMRTNEDGAAAIEKLDGVELKGRNLAVRESNN